jgi:outer membrane protein assembly factor BamE (lipoprotein component of BamABCDE complex)
MPIAQNRLTAILLCSLSFFSLTLSQQTTIDRLERRIADLEKRVAILEAKLQSPTPNANPYSEKWKDRTLWRRLQTDMSMDQVESLLGIPRKVSGGDVTFWYYSSESWHSYVSFYKGRVHGWKEPD